MGRPSNTEQRRAEIVSALLSVMAQKGYEKASIQSIAKEAKLTPGLIHYHFKIKKDILIALANWISDNAQKRIEKMNEVSNDPWEKLEVFVNARLSLGETMQPEIVSAWVMISGESVRNEEVKEIYEGLIERQLRYLEETIASVWQGKSKHSKEVIELSAMVTAMIEGCFQLSVTANTVMPNGYAASNVLKLLQARINQS